MLTCFSASEKQITVKVGTASKPFKMHESILCSSSEFFQTRNKVEWSHDEKPTGLPDHSPETFNIYVNWLYTRKVPSLKGDEIEKDRYKV